MPVTGADKSYLIIFTFIKPKNYQMNKPVKSILLIAGLILLGYGIYTLIAPEASISIGGMSLQAQDNINSYVTIGLGLMALTISLLGGRKT